MVKGCGNVWPLSQLLWTRLCNCCCCCSNHWRSYKETCTDTFFFQRNQAGVWYWEQFLWLDRMHLQLNSIADLLKPGPYKKKDILFKSSKSCHKEEKKPSTQAMPLELSSLSFRTDICWLRWFCWMLLVEQAFVLGKVVLMWTQFAWSTLPMFY